MIHKFQINILRNPEHFQFISSACGIFAKYNADADNFGPLYDQLNNCRNAEETALAVEKGNEKIREKNAMDDYRDRLHSKLFNHIKSILCDEKDSRFDAAQRVMKIIKEVGNPTRLAENAESAMLTTLGNKLAAHGADLETVGAQEDVDKLMDANRQFIVLENECREITTMLATTTAPSMSAVRKQTDPVYRKIVNAINSFADLPGREAVYAGLVSEINTLVDKYDLLLAGRKGDKGEK